MKKIALTVTALAAANIAMAQYDANTAQDAVRFATDNLTGTARFRGLGGAMGALGADASAIGINPAGSSIFNYNSFSTTISSYNKSNKASYFNNTTTRRDNNFDLNQMGIFLVYNNGNANAKMNKFAFGFNYENNQSYANITNIIGINPTNSITNYFLHYANGFGNSPAVPFNFVNTNINNFSTLNYAQQQAYLGYQGFAINGGTDGAGNTVYTANIPEGSTNFYQDSYIRETGFNGKVAMNFSAQFLKKLSLGGNVNLHFTDYIKTTDYIEDIYNPNAGDGLQTINLISRRYTYGGGISFNAGAIYNVNNNLRLGAAYESPTWLTLQDEITQSVYSTTGNDTPYAAPETTLSGVYSIKVPAKYTGSAAFIFGKKGLLSIDYGIRNYSNLKYQNSRYNDLNTEISQTLRTAGDLRIGTEWRAKMMSFRAGYRSLQSPYKTNGTTGNLNSASAGLGYSFGGSRIDLTYTWQQQKNNISTYRPGLTDSALVKTTGNNISLSYTLDL